jgi:hypothetical protein
VGDNIVTLGVEYVEERSAAQPKKKGKKKEKKRKKKGPAAIALFLRLSLVQKQ